jgi:short-subunit dehydrogenase
MSQGNASRIAITGHTRGIGKAIADLYTRKGFEVVGLSKSNNYDIEHDQKRIMLKMEDCDLIVLNAMSGKGQLDLLKRIYGQFHFRNKKVAVITSTSGTDAGCDTDIKTSTYKEYCRLKKELIEYISELQQELINKPLSVYDVCPDTVDTEMSKGLWEEWPKLDVLEVAQAVEYCFTATFNVNKIVIQKNAY